MGKKIRDCWQQKQMAMPCNTTNAFAICTVEHQATSTVNDAQRNNVKSEPCRTLLLKIIYDTYLAWYVRERVCQVLSNVPVSILMYTIRYHYSSQPLLLYSSFAGGSLQEPQCARLIMYRPGILLGKRD